MEKIKAKVIKTGKTISVVNVAHGTWRNLKTGQCYMFDQLEFIKPRKTMISLTGHYKRIGLSIYARDFVKFREAFLLPTVSMSYVNGYDRYLDMELKFLFFAVGVRFIIIKKR